MNARVILEMADLSETLAAFSTCAWFLAVMNAAVSYKNARSAETLVTFITDVSV